MINFEKFLATSVLPLKAYTPGEQPKSGSWIKLNTNEMPYSPSPKVKSAIIKALGNGDILRLYPNPESTPLREAVAKYYGLKQKNAIAGNGSDDILNLVIRAFSDNKKSVGAMNPSYTLYPVLTQMQGSKIVYFDYNKDLSLPVEKICKSKANLFILTNPNAPMGFASKYSQIQTLAKNFKGVLLIDEAYAPFSEYSCAPLVKKFDNVIVCSTSSKGWALAGMRAGWALANENLISILDRVRDSYNLDVLAQAAAVAALEDKAYYQKLFAKVIATRTNLENFFTELNWSFYKSSSNFILVKAKNKKNEESPAIAKSLFDYLKSKKILVRYFPSYKEINSSLRISIGTDNQMSVLKKEIKNWLKK